MARIRLLDVDTINKIAAGEVIERPASVVKELVENSIDAGAGKVLIELGDGGKSFIRITDDGCGIDAQDLPLAFQKHATSKISEAKDLENIATLGFRGEALASIASVSRSVEVKTKTIGSLSGTYLRMEGGKIAETKEVGTPVGTTITVWDLFYNVPARRKHLKGVEAENVHIADIVTELAIIHYDISFELFSGKRTIFKSVKSSSWDDVLFRLFGLKTLKGLSRLEEPGRGWLLSGVIGDPLAVRSSPDRIFVFVNGRAVSSRVLSSAVREAYRNIIPLGKSPVAVISLQISPELVDVNVHPAKREIRLLHEGEIASALTRAAARALEEHAKSTQEDMSGGMSSRMSSEGEATAPVRQSTIAEGCEQRTLPLSPEAGEMQPLIQPRPSLRILGQIKKLYIVAEGAEGLVLIDQHAAAERIRFELLQERYRNKNIRQELMQPISLELSPSEIIMMASWQETLQDIGFDVSPFGGNTYTVRAVPALGKRLESAEAVHDILRDLFSDGKVSPGSTNKDEILKLLACRGSIKSGKELTFAEMRKLVEDLCLCNNPLTCPHGRPVMVTIDQNQLERLFSRR
ncbi:MAG: DNA mismatch repair endonuclease MutL [Methanothrix sp.]|jgi:DNA mismatch repair protein MutL|nr:DNA mismatch repair endonuclease MutL [Methanothrix sp.]